MKEPVDRSVERSTEEVRAGSTPHIARYVLMISLGLAVLAMLIVLGLNMRA